MIPIIEITYPIGVISFLSLDSENANIPAIIIKIKFTIVGKDGMPGSEDFIASELSLTNNCSIPLVIPETYAVRSVAINRNTTKPDIGTAI